jgi:hypothetical protein
MLLVCSRANAQFIGGPEFIEYWRGHQAVERVGYLRATREEQIYAWRYREYIFGVVDALILAKALSPPLGEEIFCLPKGASGGQLLQAVSNWIEDNPGSWNISGMTIVALAVKETWPPTKC